MAEIKQQTKRVPALAWVGLLFCACAAIGSDVPLGAQQDCSVADTAHTGFGEIGQVQAMRAALDKVHQSASQVIEEFERSHARAVRLQRENAALRDEVKSLHAEMSRLRTVEVGAEQSLTVRAQPGGDAIGSLAHGVVVDVIECSDGNARRWCHVSAVTGESSASGWVAEDWLNPLLTTRGRSADWVRNGAQG